MHMQVVLSINKTRCASLKEAIGIPSASTCPTCQLEMYPDELFSDRYDTDDNQIKFSVDHQGLLHYLPLDCMVNIPIYLVWASWVRNGTTFLSDNRYFEILNLNKR